MVIKRMHMEPEENGVYSFLINEMRPQSAFLRHSNFLATAVSGLIKEA
jgi:hypothetical protein